MFKLQKKIVINNNKNLHYNNFFEIQKSQNKTPFSVFITIVYNNNKQFIQTIKHKKIKHLPKSQ